MFDDTLHVGAARRRPAGDKPPARRAPHGPREPIVHCIQSRFVGCVVQAPRAWRVVHKCAQKRLRRFIVAVHAPAEYTL